MRAREGGQLWITPAGRLRGAFMIVVVIHRGVWRASAGPVSGPVRHDRGCCAKRCRPVTDRGGGDGAGRTDSYRRATTTEAGHARAALARLMWRMGTRSQALTVW